MKDRSDSRIVTNGCGVKHFRWFAGIVSSVLGISILYGGYVMNQLSAQERRIDINDQFNAGREEQMKAFEKWLERIELKIDKLGERS